MKKLIVSMMLIIGMFAFAAESDPSATVGYVKYGCVTTAGTDQNLVALPVDAGYATVGAFDPTGSNVGTIAKWDAASQMWSTTSYNALFGWIGDYAAVEGQAYMLTCTADFDFIVDGPVVSIPAYNLVTTAGTDQNLIMHPLTKASLATAGAIGTDIGVANVGTIAAWNNATQMWGTTSYNALFGWIGDYASEIGNPLMLTMTGDTTWPSAKLADNNWSGIETTGPKGSIIKDFYYEVFQPDGVSHYDFSAAPYDGVTAKAWVDARPAELQTTGGGGMNYFNLSGISVIQFNMSNFPTTYNTGEELFVVVKDEDTNIEGYNDSFILDALDGSAVFEGPNLGVGGNGITTDTPSSIEDGMVPEVTKLHQNYPNPFNPTTTIKFDLAANTEVKLNVYNYNGQMVKSLVGGQMNAGFHTVNFDASNLSAGVYYYTLEADSKVMTNKMVLVK